ncbi:hypothetical protein PIIN_03201 [Serendipita indica DSM 11827]|uniref:Peptidase S1 domain-containing protein n=1 Tax=Serendipita indica (strain DSM 11827) TaxID=1109443 RepID=G4TDA9_SERID|nr:hypothetical protein PIIN_03201 [Serendipita indica DSM 11827]
MSRISSAEQGFPTSMSPSASRRHASPAPADPSFRPFSPWSGSIAEFRHPFASTLGLYVAPLKHPYSEGTIGLYLQRNEETPQILALTAAHVIRPPFLYHNAGSKHTDNAQRREEIVNLGGTSYADVTTRIMSRIGTLQGVIASLKRKIRRLKKQQAQGSQSIEVDASLRQAEQYMGTTRRNIEQLDSLHTKVTKFTTNAKQRVIGSVFHVDPIRLSPTLDSSDTGKRFIIDWKMIKINQDASDHTGGWVKEEEYASLMFPHPSDRGEPESEYPQDGLLQISGVVPEEICHSRQRKANGEAAMPVIKNGLTTGTTVGWVNGLDSLVRLYTNYGLECTSFETTVLPYGERGAFSDDGDSGSIILDRGGRIVPLLTGRGGTARDTDVTFATAWYKLEPHIQKTLPGCSLYPPVPNNEDD